ncbi:ACP S-malonyltransferase [Brevibacillus dissolubilis]|uniref:ACP S-malonyltransferase n=1 Tax=Brevibacillus dissolubilis TaxID=1844116 RepID=UPI0011165EBF|nr:ACP S-malonyltransferase [Brevibacillus dissolubilis]
MVTYVFPGQGSQHKGMGGTLFDEFAHLTAQADQILGYSIKQLCLEDPAQELGKTQFTQPALFVVNALSYLKKVNETGRKPDYVAGHSLGEYNALFAAGAFDFETGVKLVKKRGELMSQAAEGGMAAVIGFSPEKINEVLIENGLTEIDIANHNSPSQIVIAGRKADIQRAKPIFEAAGVRVYLPLNVSGAFHSRYMSDAERIFADYLNQFPFAPLAIPVISNIHARPYKQADLKTNLVKQITNQVKWTETIRYLMGRGEMEIVEVGPGNVLTKLVTTIRREAEPLVVADEAEQAMAEVAAAVEAPSSTPQPSQQAAAPAKSAGLSASSLGDEQFKKDYNLKYAYVTGSMYKGIASEEMVIRVGKAGMLGFYGTGGMSVEQVEKAIRRIQQELNQGQAYGMNLLHNLGNPTAEMNMIDLYLQYGVRIMEASAFMSITPALIKYRAKGLSRNADGTIHTANKLIAKVSRPEVAEVFLSPAPEHMVEKLLQENQLTSQEAEWLKSVPMADDITVEADSGGHTDMGIAYTLMPAMIKLRNEKVQQYGYAKKVRIGAAGGIGTPEAAAAAFILGAEYITTGSINQCTVEAGTSDAVKDLLQQANVQDNEYAPAGDMFELGAKVQVLKKGLFFPARANKLYDLYRQFNSLDEIDDKTKKMIQEKYFYRTFDEVYQEIKDYKSSAEVEKAEKNPKHKMSLVFKWYFAHSTRLALAGDQAHRVDYQIHCGPAMGAFNQWVKGTPLEEWRNRHVDEIGLKLLTETAETLTRRLSAIVG